MSYSDEFPAEKREQWAAQRNEDRARREELAEHLWQACQAFDKAEAIYEIQHHLWQLELRIFERTTKETVDICTNAYKDL